MAYWWECYGPFDPGVDNLPTFYQVIRYYRELRGMSMKELAIAYKRSVRFIEMLEKDTNKDMPKSNPRRVALAKILGMPGALLGVSIIGSDDDIQHEIRILDTHTLTFYEDMLASVWELYHTSSVTRTTQHLDLWLGFLQQETKKARGIKKDQLKSVLCRFYQLSALIARERLDTTRALSDEKAAIALAFELGNVELIASSLQRRARIYIQNQQYQLAYQDAQNALPYADRSRAPLKGKTYQIAGESLAYLAGNNKDLQKKSLSFFDTAGTITRKGNLEPDGTFMKLDITSLYIERAEAFILFKQFPEAENALAIARKKLSPELTRWLVNILLTEADMHYAQHLYDSSADSALQALTISQSLGLESKKKRVQALYSQLLRVIPNDPSVRRLGQNLSIL